MNVDRLPESGDDPRPAADTTRSADSPRPETAAEPEPQPEQSRTPDDRELPEHHPAPDRQPTPEPEPERDPKPEPEREHQRAPEPERDHLPDSSPEVNSADSPANATREPAEPRSRQEHAAPPSADEHEIAAEDEVGDRGPTRSADAGTGPDEEHSPAELEDPPDGRPGPHTAPESALREKADQHQIFPADYHEGDDRPDMASHKETSPNDTDTPKPASQDREAHLPDNEAGPANDWIGSQAEEWTEHLVEVREALDSGRREGLTSKHLYTIDGAGEIWTEERDRLHDAIIEDAYNKAADVPCEFRAIIAGGLGGAGKTTVLTQYAGFDLSQYLMINPDSMKEEMAHRGMIPEVEGLSPMEASELVHEESSYLASQLAFRAQANGKNLIWDITMSSEESVTKRINELTAAGYTRIDGLFVDIPVETSLRRIESRHREGHELYRSGHGLGGRYVPPEVINSQEDPEFGSKNMRTFNAVKQRFSGWSIYDNSMDGRSPILVDTSDKEQANK